MGDMREDFEALGEYLKDKHDERVAKTPDRVDYAISLFEKHGIKYELKNPGIGHFHCWRKSDGKLFEFWAGTGKIKGFNNRGIHFLINQLNKKMYSKPVNRKQGVRINSHVKNTEKILKENGIVYELKNATSGHFHCWRLSDGALFQYWSGTGKVLGYAEKGIDFLISELLK